MKQVLLIAWREYRQYIFSRGFLLFLVLFPVGMLAIGGAMGLVEQSKPVRTFLVLDKTGRYVEAIDREITRRRNADILMAWDMYAGATVEARGENLPAPFKPDGIDEARLAAFDEAGGAEAAQRAAQGSLIRGAPGFVAPRPEFERIDAPEWLQDLSLADAEEALRPYLLEEREIASDGRRRRLFAAVFLPDAFSAKADSEAAQYWSRNLTDTALQGVVSTALDRALRREALVSAGLPQSALDDVAAISAPLHAFRPDKAAEDAQLGFEDRIETALPAAMTYMLLVIIFGVGNLLLTNTIEERSNKIVEILLSSVTAGQLMMGKLIGIAAVGLTMPTIFLFGGAAMSVTTTGDGSLMNIVIGALFSSPLLLIYLFYFFCAYAIFAMIFLAIGAVSNSLQDAQSYMGPVMLLVFAPLPFMILVFQNPNGFVASVLTWIPIYTPYAVMMRAAADPPLWEIIGATILMLAFAVFLARIMGRIFRQAILQASPPKAKEIWALARGKGE